MRISVLQTFVLPTAKGMIVGNAGDTLDIDEALFEQLGDRVAILDEPHDHAMTAIDFDTPQADAELAAEEFAMARRRLDDLADKIAGDDAEPAPPAPAKNKGGRPAKAKPQSPVAADPHDAPVA